MGLLQPLTLALLALCALACSGKEEAPPPPPPPVDVAYATRRDVPDELRTIGTVVPIQTVGLKSRVEGQLVEIAFREGELVEAGQLLFQLDPRPFENAVAVAEANLQRDRAQARFAKIEARRVLSLAKRGAASIQDAQARSAASASAEAAVQADEAQLQNAQLSLSFTSIHAPFTGRTGALNFHLGDQVPANSSVGLVRLVQISPIEVSFSLPSDRLNDIRAAAALGTLVVRASPRGRPGELHQGELVFIDNEADPNTGTILLKGRFPNEEQALWPGLFTDVSLVVGVYEAAVVVPSAAVQRGQEGAYVFVLGAGDKVEARQVRTGPRSGERIVIRSGVSAGEQVVTDGQLRLQPGMEVRVRNREGEAEAGGGAGAGGGGGSAGEGGVGGDGSGAGGDGQ